MGLQAIDETQMNAFYNVVKHTGDITRADASKILTSDMQKVADALLAAKEQSKEKGEALPASDGAFKEKYAPFIHYAEKISFGNGTSIDGRDVKFAATAFMDGKGDEGVERAFSGAARAHANLLGQAIKTIEAAYGNSPNLQPELAKLTKMNPDLAQDISAATKSGNTAEGLKPILINLNTDKYDTYGDSKAAYDFKHLADMQKSDPEFKEAFGKAIKDNSIVGEYVAAYKIAEKKDPEADLTNLSKTYVNLIKSDVVYPYPDKAQVHQQEQQLEH